jgi:hypothetical protein
VEKAIKEDPLTCGKSPMVKDAVEEGCNYEDGGKAFFFHCIQLLNTTFSTHLFLS